MWAGRAGRGVIGRTAAAQSWPPTHSANEQRASRTRGPSGDRRDVASFSEKNTRFDLLRTPGFFLFGRVIIRERVLRSLSVREMVRSVRRWTCVVVF